MKVGTGKAFRISFKDQLLTEEKLRKFIKQQLKEKNIISLEKQLKEENTTRN
jgi:hypothetical protein